ncbi:MAG: hypothetical protein ON057_000471 [Glomeribacter sp. 1016415]|nr:hypothetical protein [Glomeribacter sp. 1016415]
MCHWNTLTTNEKKRFSLEEKVRNFLASEEKKVLFLLGEADSGKLTYNRYFASNFCYCPCYLKLRTIGHIY